MKFGENLLKIWQRIKCHSYFHFYPFILYICIQDMRWMRLRSRCVLCLLSFYNANKKKLFMVYRSSRNYAPWSECIFLMLISNEWLNGLWVFAIFFRNSDKMDILFFRFWLINFCLIKSLCFNQLIFFVLGT